MRKWKKCRLEFLAVIKLDSVLFFPVGRSLLFMRNTISLRCLVMTFECGFDTPKEMKKKKIKNKKETNTWLLKHFLCAEHYCRLWWSFDILVLVLFYLKIIQLKMLKVVHILMLDAHRPCKWMKLCKFIRLNFVIVLVHVCVIQYQ